MEGEPIEFGVVLQHSRKMFVSAQPRSGFNAIEDLVANLVISEQNPLENLKVLYYFTFHSWMPADQFCCIVTSRRSPVVATDLKLTLLKRSFSTP
jgi:hypothetical protein